MKESSNPIGRCAEENSTNCDRATECALSVVNEAHLRQRRRCGRSMRVTLAGTLVSLTLAVVARVIQCQQEIYYQPGAGPVPLPLAPNSAPILLETGGWQGRVDGPLAQRRFVVVPGNEELRREPNLVDEVILPYDSFETKQQKSELEKTSYVIDHKRFVEPYATRCMASTLLEDPDSFEPNFVIIRPNSEVRVNASAPAEQIRAAGFNPRQATTIFVHGFTQSYPDTEWLRKARALHEMHGHVGRQNLLFMDWNTGSHGSYSQVAARTSAMGSFLANFLMKLVDDLGAERASIHLIGHSLGAHVAGFAGKRIRPRLGRITGLDAAGPCFGKLFSNSANDRLARDDALEVDVFHYDDGFLGLPGQIGQFDVYVNGGASQPGATDNMNSMVQALITMVFRRNRVLSESHTRSTEVATSQLSRSNCQLIAYECRDWPAFLAGECGQCDQTNNQCFSMGFYFQYQDDGTRRPTTATAAATRLRRAHSPGKKLFIVTSPKDDYCLQHFQLIVSFELSPELTNLARKQKWRIHLELINERNERSKIEMTNQLAPNVFSHLLLSEMVPFRFVKAFLQVRQADGSPVVMREAQKTVARPYSQPPRVNFLEVNFMSHVDYDARRRMSTRLCPSGWLDARDQQNAIEDSSSSEGKPSDLLTLDLCA